MPQSRMFSASDGYELFMGRWSRELAPKFVEFAGIRPSDKVLDVGCGTGALTLTAMNTPDVQATGVDPSVDYIQFAAARVPSDRASFQVARAQSLPYSDAQFDRTMALLVLNFVPDSGAALREMVRVTRPGGVVAAAVWDYADGMRMLREFWDAAVAVSPAAASRDEAYMPLCRRGELASKWRAHGLQNVHEDAITIRMRYASFDDYWKPFLTGQGPAGAYIASIPALTLTTIERRLRQRLDANAAFTLPARAWAVRGVVAR